MNDSIYTNTRLSEWQSLEGEDIVVLHPHDFRCLKQWGPWCFEKAADHEQEVTGIVGSIGKLTLKLSEMAPRLGRKGLKKFVERSRMAY